MLLKFALVRPPFLLAQIDGLQILILADTGFMDGLRLLVVVSPTFKGKYPNPPTSMQSRS